jgi:uncharacterized protein YcfJ
MGLLNRTSSALCLMALASAPAVAQSADSTTVLQVENVKLDYAHVLNVEPVYQTLRASRMEMQCEEVAPAKPARPPEQEEKGRWSRLINSMKGAFSDEPDEPPTPALPAKPECRMVPVKREFRRPIAYDVDYVYRGMQYRSRLAEDPGNRLRIRVSVMPYVPDGDGARP